MPVPRPVLLNRLREGVTRLSDAQLKQFAWYLQDQMEQMGLWPQVDEDLALHPEDPWDEWLYHMAMVKEAADLMQVRGLVRAANVCSQIATGQATFDKPPTRQEAESRRTSVLVSEYTSDLRWDEEEPVDFFSHTVLAQNVAFEKAQKRRRRAEVTTSESEGEGGRESSRQAT